MTYLTISGYTFDKISSLHDYRHASEQGSTIALCGKHIRTDIVWTLDEAPSKCQKCLKVLADKDNE